ncbi:hypothetical protein GH714_029448 [Hevea brasiliensis]|uniref:Uncharacterized protein n=1 Tax=Hevea brasiliensis TaxID=3981 RepID=A0A6A6N383_HEVBR|nr:hypothetical protein GH714_029448 [Hevea brasiliensis]
MESLSRSIASWYTSKQSVSLAMPLVIGEAPLNPSSQDYALVMAVVIPTLTSLKTLAFKVAVANLILSIVTLYISEQSISCCTTSTTLPIISSAIFLVISSPCIVVASSADLARLCTSAALADPRAELHSDIASKGVGVGMEFEGSLMCMVGTSLASEEGKEGVLPFGDSENCIRCLVIRKNGLCGTRNTGVGREFCMGGGNVDEEVICGVGLWAL